MRWTSPKENDIRIRKFFAWLPVTICWDCGSSETRWLETVQIKEQYRRGRTGYYWVRLGFLDL